MIIFFPPIPANEKCHERKAIFRGEIEVKKNKPLVTAQGEKLKKKNCIDSNVGTNERGEYIERDWCNFFFFFSFFFEHTLFISQVFSPFLIVFEFLYYVMNKTLANVTSYKPLC